MNHLIKYVNILAIFVRLILYTKQKINKKMSKNKKEETKYSLETVAEILCTTPRNIKKNSGNGNIPKLRYKQKEPFLYKSDLLKHFNIEELEEPFIRIEEAAEIAGVLKSAIKKATKSELNSYRITNARGSITLLKKSEVLEWVDWKMIVSWQGSTGYGLYNSIMEYFNSILLLQKSPTRLSDREYEFLKRIFMDKDNTEEIAKELDIGMGRLRQLFHTNMRKMNKNLKQIVDNYDTLVQKNFDHIRLEKENTLLKEKNSELEKKLGLLPEKEKLIENPYLSKKIIDCNFSVGLLNVLRRFFENDIEVRTLKDIVDNITPIKFLKLRNAGEKKLTELEETLTLYDMTLRK